MGCAASSGGSVSTSTDDTSKVEGGAARHEESDGPLNSVAARDQNSSRRISDALHLDGGAAGAVVAGDSDGTSSGHVAAAAISEEPHGRTHHHHRHRSPRPTRWHVQRQQPAEAPAETTIVVPRARTCSTPSSSSSSSPSPPPSDIDPAAAGAPENDDDPLNSGCNRGGALKNRRNSRRKSASTDSAVSLSTVGCETDGSSSNNNGRASDAEVECIVRLPRLSQNAIVFTVSPEGSANLGTPNNRSATARDFDTPLSLRDDSEL